MGFFFFFTLQQDDITSGKLAILNLKYQTQSNLVTTREFIVIKDTVSQYYFSWIFDDVKECTNHNPLY